MKKIKTLAPVVLAVLLVLSFYKLYTDRAAVKAEYDKYVNEARKFAEQEIAVDAITNYSKALQMNDTLELSLEVGEFYVKMDDIRSAISWGERLVENYPREPQAYEFLLKLYYNSNDYHRTFSTLKKVDDLKLHTETTKEISEKAQYLYFFEEVFEDAGSFNCGLAPVCIEGNMGFVDETAVRQVPFKFAKVGAFIDNIAPVETVDGEHYYVDTEGNKKVVIKDAKKIKGLGNFGGEYYPVYNGKTWDYYNTEFKKAFGGFEYASTMANGLASVKENDYYYLIDVNGNKVSNQKYSGIVEDFKGIVTRNGVSFVNIDGLYYMVDNTGKKVSNQSYISADLFLDETYAAVETEKGWCFIDNTGKQVFEKQYFDEAKSFSNGLAAVKKAGRWGFINLEGELVIDYKFEDAQHFSSKGSVFVKQEEIWSLLRLYSHNYED